MTIDQPVRGRLPDECPPVPGDGGVTLGAADGDDDWLALGVGVGVGVEVGVPVGSGLGSSCTSRVRAANEMPVAPPTTWVDARTSEPAWPPAATVKPPSSFCWPARNDSALAICRRVGARRAG